MSFSTAIVINDVDDYILPSKSCIKPVKIDKKSGTTKQLRIEEDGTYTGIAEDGTARVLEKATITLNDCLACSGCITTSESVLISAHSVDSFLNFVRRNREQTESSKLFAVSVSPQSVASLANELYGSDTDSAFSRWFRQHPVSHVSPGESRMNAVYDVLVKVFHQLGAHIVVNTTEARGITLMESASEFIQRYHNAPDQLPLFCSICPGWVCYAEKTPIGGVKSSSLIDHLSAVRSPQQITGRLLKQNDAQSVYHVSVMPCFDKKLEASRPEFANMVNETQSVPDVDLVLATNELMDVLQRVCPRNGDLLAQQLLTGPPELAPHLHDTLCKLKRLFSIDAPDTTRPPLYRHPGSGSGGYADFVFRSAARELFGITIRGDISTDPRVIVRQLTNKDIQEWILFASSEERDQSLHVSGQSRTPYRSTKRPNEALLVFAVANGFRNIQNIVKPLKTKSLKNMAATQSRYPFDYVEVMACPGGCLSGGGQLKTTDSNPTDSDYFKLPELQPDNEWTRQLYESMKQSDPTRACFRTTYREIQQIDIINPAALQW